MITRQTNLGTIEISPNTIVSLAEQAVLQLYGVVGLTERNRFEAWRRGIMKSEQGRKGVLVTVTGEGVRTDLCLIIEYGARISEVAKGVVERMKYNVEKTLGLPVLAVNVHVQALRVSPRAGHQN